MFTFIHYKVVDKELIKKFFHTDGFWYTYASEAMTFKTKKQAKEFYKTHPMMFPIATIIYVQGPRGGVTRMGDI